MENAYKRSEMDRRRLTKRVHKVRAAKQSENTLVLFDLIQFFFSKANLMSTSQYLCQCTTV